MSSVRCVLKLLLRLVFGGVRFAGWSTSACKTNTTQNQLHQISNTQRTENKTTDVVIHQQSRKLLKMDIMSETCWAYNKWNKISGDIKLVFHSSTNQKLCRLCQPVLQPHVQPCESHCKYLYRTWSSCSDYVCPISPHLIKRIQVVALTCTDNDCPFHLMDATVLTQPWCHLGAHTETQNANPIYCVLQQNNFPIIYNQLIHHLFTVDTTISSRICAAEDRIQLQNSTYWICGIQSDTRLGFCVVLRSYTASGLSANIDIWSPIVLRMGWNVMSYRLINNNNNNN